MRTGLLGEAWEGFSGVGEALRGGPRGNPLLEEGPLLPFPLFTLSPFFLSSPFFISASIFGPLVPTRTTESVE